VEKKVDTLIRESLREAATLLLWKSGAIRINLEKPFQLVSGNFSPIYVNCRQVISDPVLMGLFTAAARLIVSREAIPVDMLAGGVTAGVPFAAYLAQALNLPLVYVRKAVKGYGIANQVEGGTPQGKRVLLVEDLITDAGSKINFIEALRDADAMVQDVLVLYDRLQGGAAALKNLGIRLHALTDMDSALVSGEQAGLFPSEAFRSVREYLSDPKKWHEERGLEFS